MLSVVWLVVGSLLRLFHNRPDLIFENFVLRKQLTVLKQHRPRLPLVSPMKYQSSNRNAKALTSEDAMQSTWTCTAPVGATMSKALATNRWLIFAFISVQALVRFRTSSVRAAWRSSMCAPRSGSEAGRVPKYRPKLCSISAIVSA